MPSGSPLIEGSRYEEYAPTIFALTAAIDAKDHFTFNYSQNVTEYFTTRACDRAEHRPYKYHL